MAERIMVYPGSFDPVTNGHLDLIFRGLTICDRLIVAVITNPAKTPFFPLEERIEMLQEATRNTHGRVIVDAFDGLLVQFMEKRKARVLLRGLRAVSDFEYEFEMALTNRRLNHDVETIFMAPSEEYIFLRATLVKEIARYGGKLKDFVPPNVERRLLERHRTS